MFAHCRYFMWYDVQGIFLDEGSNSCTMVPYYDALVAYIRAWLPTAVTALNWGTGNQSTFCVDYTRDLRAPSQGNLSYCAVPDSAVLDIQCWCKAVAQH